MQITKEGCIYRVCVCVCGRVHVRACQFTVTSTKHLKLAGGKKMLEVQGSNEAFL